MLEKLATNCRSWSSGRDTSFRVAASTYSDSLSALTQQIDMLNQKVGELKGAPVEQAANLEEVNYVHNGGQNRNFNNNSRPNQGSSGYNNINHANMTYGNPDNAVMPSPGFAVSNGRVVQEPKSSSLIQEDLLRTILATSDTYITEQAATSKKVTQLDHVVGGMSTQMKGLRPNWIK